MMEYFMEGDMLTRRNPLSLFGGGIGYSFRYYLTDLVGNADVKMLEVDGVYPDSQSIRDGSYPLTTDFYVVYRRDNDNPNVETLVLWLTGEEVQELIYTVYG